MSDLSANRGDVLLLHGHGRTGGSMLALANRLRKAGHRTLAPSYGFRRSMPAILDHLFPRIAAFQAGSEAPFHIITHSLGGLVARALIANRRPARLSRVVMMAPPNGGSELADMLGRLQLRDMILGPIGRHLVTSRGDEDQRMLGEAVDYELGIIAGNRPLSPYMPAILFSQPNDGKVSVPATRLEGMKDHVVLPVPHALMVHHPQSIEQALAFIETGHFLSAKPSHS